MQGTAVANSCSRAVWIKGTGIRAVERIVFAGSLRLLDPIGLGLCANLWWQLRSCPVLSRVGSQFGDPAL